MNPQKFKDWLIKIGNANLQKPSENAHLQALTAEVQDLSVQVNNILNKQDKKMVLLEDQVNHKTSELMEIENKTKENWYTLQKKAEKQKDRKVALIKSQTKQLIEETEIMKRKFHSMQFELQQKNRAYLELLTVELHKLKQIRIQSSVTKQKTEKIYEDQLRKRIRKADQIRESQEKDLLLIDKYEKQLLSRCDEIQNSYEKRLRQKWQRSEHKQKILLRKLQVLISDVDID